jgi:hypothetical protein
LFLFLHDWRTLSVVQDFHGVHDDLVCGCHHRIRCLLRDDRCDFSGARPEHRHLRECCIVCVHFFLF